MVPDEMVTRVGGIVLSVDEDLHVLGWSGQAQERLDLAETGAQGRRCYDIVSAIDAETGRACRENCPLARDSARPGWAFGRTLEIEELGPGNTRLDCLQLKYVTPGGKPANLCFLGPSNGPTSEAASPGLRALEAIYPLVTGLADIWDVLGASLKAVVSTTSADGGEVFLLDNQTGELVATESRGLSSEKMEEFRLSALGDRVPDVVAWSRLPLLAAGTWPANGTGSPSGSYLCAPLVAEGRVLGALAIASRQRDFDVALAGRQACRDRYWPEM